MLLPLLLLFLTDTVTVAHIVIVAATFSDTMPTALTGCCCCGYLVVTISVSNEFVFVLTVTVNAVVPVVSGILLTSTLAVAAVVALCYLSRIDYLHDGTCQYLSHKIYPNKILLTKEL